MPLTSPGRRRYSSPPIQEALCQLMFAEPIKWTVATPGLIYQTITGDYPAEPESQEEVQAEFRVPGQDQQMGLTFNRGNARVIFKDETGKKLVVVNPQSYSVNSLRPYEGWESLHDRLITVGAALADTGIASEISEVKIRYINVLSLPAGDIDLDDYFHIPIPVPSGNEVAISAFMTRVQSIINDDTRASLTFASVDAPPPPAETPDSSNFVLDLEFSRTIVAPTDIVTAANIASELKELENTQFENLITDLTRERFE